MPDYSKNIIYKLCCKNLDVKNIYVGSTCNFTKRKSAHKTDSNNLNCKKYNLKVYKFIRDNGGFENWEMIMIEEYPCENKMQKIKRERHHIELLCSTLNSYVPGRDMKEYYQDNKEKIKEYRKNNSDKMKEYREDNKQKVKEFQKEWYEKNKERIKEKNEKNKDAIKQSQKEYNEKNKDAHNQKRKEHYQNNKDVICQRRRELYHKKKNELLLKDNKE